LLGFNFYPKSPRYLAPEACAFIVAELKSPAVKVGVFVNESIAHVRQLMAQCGLDLAQLHGDETVQQVAALEGRAFKAFRGTGLAHADFAAAGPGAPAFLVDAYSPAHYGGTGRVADWSAARRLAEQYPILLAGGLTPENVAAAVARVRPWGVDVASGVESAPGHKDHARLRAFVRSAKQAGEQISQLPDPPTLGK
jgi:phosphoribosylanthranilate isomerase